MNKQILAGSALAVSLALSTAASAGVVTFNTLYSPSNNVDLGYDSAYVEGDLSFRAFGTDGRNEHLFIWGDTERPGYDADSTPNGASPWVNSINAFLRITKVGGGTFTLNSLDLADYLNARQGLSNYDMAYAYVDGGGSHNGVFHLDNTPGLQTFAVNFADITRIDLFTGGSEGPGVQIDNVHYNEVAAAPEPAAWALMLLGFGGLGVELRRRRSLTT